MTQRELKKLFEEQRVEEKRPFSNYKCLLCGHSYTASEKVRCPKCKSPIGVMKVERNAQI